MAGSIRRNLRRAMTVTRREISYYTRVPREAGIELTYRCNLRCKMCGVFGKIRDQNEQELTVAEYRNLFAQMREMGIGLVTFTGGEPFVRKDLFDVVGEAKSQGLRCNIFSNGTLVSGDTLERVFESGVDKLIFSVDGMNGVHDEIRGIPGSFEKVIGTITNLTEARRARGIEQPAIDAHMTLMKGNVTSLSPLSDLCRSLGINFSFQPYSESNSEAFKDTLSVLAGVKSNRYLPHDGTLHFTEEDLGILREELKKLPVNFYTKLMAYFKNVDLKTGLMPLKKCYFTRSFIMLDPYGNVFPCTNLDSYKMGNVRNQSLSAIWKGEKYEGLRGKLSQGLLPLCAYCCHLGDNLRFGQLARIMFWRPGSR
jgi:radical SAM protein with 4Fe4S-binding SPASM domain